MIKLLVLLISAAVVVNSCVGGNYVDSSGVDERTMYGWEVQITSGSFQNSCYGIFIGPRVFLTHSECIENSGMFKSIKITNSILISEVLQTQFIVSHSNVYTGSNLKKRTTVFDRKVAFLIINEPVIPANETTANSFVKLAEDIDDVDLSKCFIPEIQTPPIIIKSSCNLEDNDFTDKSIKDFRCSYDFGETRQGNGLFCQLKENPDSKVLIGYVGNKFVYFDGWFHSPGTVINLTGLNIAIMSL